MISRMIIGPRRYSDVDVIRIDEWDAHPSDIERHVEHVHLREPRPYAVCTTHPTTINRVIKIWDDRAASYARITLRSHRYVDTPLLQVKDADWLAHFSLEDLYLRGEFDEVLR